MSDDQALFGAAVKWWNEMWTFEPAVYACPECWAKGDVVAMGLSDRAWIDFRTNKTELFCPNCEFHSPHYAYIHLPDDDYTQNEWIIPSHVSRQAELPNMTLVRRPSMNSSGKFNDNRKLTKPNNREEEPL